MTAKTSRVAAELARQSVLDAVGKLRSALDDVVEIVGNMHSASQAIEAAHHAARVASSKLDILIRRIP